MCRLYRSSVDGVDVLDGARVDVESLGEVCQQDVERARCALVEQLADDVARSRPGADHVDHLVPRRSERPRRVVLV